MAYRFLVALDVEGDCDYLLDHLAEALGTCTKPRLTLLTVLPPMPDELNRRGWFGDNQELEVAEARREEWITQALAAAYEKLEAARDRLARRGLNPDAIEVKVVEPAEEEPVRGAAEAIRREAASGRYGTVVVGRGSRSMITAWVAGQVTERLVRKPLGAAIWAIERPS
ncbi:MAG: hypothetical protein D6739_04340 [Nitrospirae bacterium]|nr:MAG: hypothetical protein D6739_04340 [Nitrospirota bacterium]